MGGSFDCFSSLLSLRGGHRHKKKRRVQQTVELKVMMDCDGCELRVRNALSNMKGVHSVETNRKQQKVTVTGYAEPNKVLNKVRSTTGKKAELWPYVPYNLVAHPYTAQAYDKKAPPGYVRNVVDYSYGSVPSSFASSRQGDLQIADMFSDDNPNACFIM